MKFLPKRLHCHIRGPIRFSSTEIQPPPDELNRLINDANLFSPLCIPRHPIVLSHGLYGFDTWTPPLPAVFPALELHYWSDVLNIMQNKFGVKVIVPGVPGTGSVQERAQAMHDFIKEKPHRELNFLAHSMGGLDCRWLISNITPTEYRPMSLTTISTPHHGSEFMDWLAANIGIGAKDSLDSQSMSYTFKKPILAVEENAMLSALSNAILKLVDSPAYSNLTTTFAKQQFNPSTPDSPDVKYFSVAVRKQLSTYHPLWLPQTIISMHAKDSVGNDGLVSVESAKWGELIGIIENVDHWELKGGRGFLKNPKDKEGWNWSLFNQSIRKWLTVKTDAEPSSIGSVVNFITKHMPTVDTSRMTSVLRGAETKQASGENRKVDMEVFFAAICRKLYNEGL